ncbi:bifunctional phosphopantothenoylcysteine decarboxylase/phosphopantothenate--cysteine ligase CoaBC [Limosilactobacillus pontis]|uniref:bifunctional phosphopantothenoylcysteine decarboxylase/phosphopantothenate--cysteine ligase CoaBC n=1 Tax=Limosilactobacillus pontis TaxID=35787 RepID=UPI0025A383C1|nr:bifunctional phosphopantothenoylcysteine decarboxylase/phosphopantothenate--cysteine ligase CoaBC [Limosilactobacillus pontis]MDM8332305.1 bifunctional phosphopantothenoylcysteine decarboxylase/phosphopantothenate--cysteine ligase CoaBC [Limosilactobacillus pontis]
MARITVYLSGSIAAYKGIEVVRGLQKAGHEVRVVMTTAATKLVGPATLNALTKYPVLTDLWNDQSQPIPHIELADWTELTLVVPASADLLAKMANGIADDAASTTLLATAAPKMVAPAMNRQMWAAPATQRNLTQLAEDGVTIIEPVTGRLAEGYSGHGRLPEPDEIVTRVHEFLSQRGQLAGRRVVVTAGGTREPLDPVRYIGNRSSGKMGIAIARAAAQAGAQVTLITGQVSVSLPQDANIHPVSALTTEEMLAAVQEAFVSADALIMAAAVADYRPVKVAEQKVKKGHDHELRTLELTETVDILRTIAAAKRTDQLVVGFAAETEKLLDHAQEKLASKHADMIVANSVAGATGAFGRDDDQVTILQKGKDPEKWPRLSKTAVAQRLVARLAEQLK